MLKLEHQTVCAYWQLKINDQSNEWISPSSHPGGQTAWWNLINLSRNRFCKINRLYKNFTNPAKPHNILVSICIKGGNSLNSMGLLSFGSFLKIVGRGDVQNTRLEWACSHTDGSIGGGYGKRYKFN